MQLYLARIWYEWNSIGPYKIKWLQTPVQSPINENRGPFKFRDCDSPNQVLLMFTVMNDIRSDTTSSVFYYANCNWRGDAKLQSVLFIQFKCNFVVVVVFSFVKLHNCLSFFSLFMTLFGRRIVVVWNYLSMWHVREKQYQFDILSTFSICIAIEIRRKLFGIYMYEIHRNSRDSVWDNISLKWSHISSLFSNEEQICTHTQIWWFGLMPVALMIKFSWFLLVK